VKKKFKIIVGAAILAAAAVCAAVYASLPLEVETVNISAAPASLTFMEQGVYAYRETYALYPLVSGEVLSVNAREGDPVKAGDVIAVVNADDYEYQIAQLESSIAGYNGQISNLWLQDQQRRDELSATMESLRGQMASLEAEMEQNDLGLDSVSQQIDIQSAIVRTNAAHVNNMRDDYYDARDTDDESLIALAQQALNSARNVHAQSLLVLEQLRAGDVSQDIYEGQRQSLQAQIDSVAAQLQKSYSGGMQSYYAAQITAAESSIEQMESKSGHAEIKATASGVISSLPIKDQNVVSQQSPVAMIGDEALVEAFVPVREIDGVKAKDRVELILDRRAGRETISGTVSQIEREAEIKLSALGVEERKVRVLIKPDAEGLHIGYEMDVRFTVASWEAALVVPKTAVFTRDGKDYIWAIENGVIASKPVSTGAELQEGYVVEEGLAGGEEIIVDASGEAIAEGKKAERAG
jgi:multidrug efflux pump subunit AcrA (membrane-fusion protein)